jgi:hypothetical protein
MSLSSTAKGHRSTRITETIMGSINDAIEKQGGNKDSWKRHEIETNKELRGQEIELQKKQYFLQNRKIKAELQIMERKSEVEMEKCRTEAALLEEQTKTVMQDRLKKLLLDRKEHLDKGVSIEDVNLLLPLQK